MYRDPAIHITHSSLIKVLEQIGLEDSKKVANAIFRNSKSFAIKDRYVVMGDSRVQRKAKKLIASSVQGDSIPVEQFQEILISERMALGHRGIKPIFKDNSQYVLLNEVAQLAYDFAKVFNFSSVKEGCRIFVNKGLSYMKKNYSLSKFKYYNEPIIKYYESAIALSTDADKNATDEFYELYRKLLVEYTGIDRELKRVEDKVCMLYARLEADEIDADYEDWLRSQFEQLGILGFVPNLTQLFNEKAVNRYYEYMMNQKSNTHKNTVKSVREAKDDFDASYNKALKSKKA